MVLVSEPEGASISMGGLHPRASLYERPVNLEQSKKQHSNFREILRSYGVKGACFTDPVWLWKPVSVLTVRGILAYGADKYMNSRIELEDLAMQALTYVLHPEFRMEDLCQADKYALSDDYKRKVIPGGVQGGDCGMTGSGGDVLFAVDRYLDDQSNCRTFTDKAGYRIGSQVWISAAV